MLWYKSWLETRWRFLVGLPLAICSAAATVWIYPRLLELVAVAPQTSGNGPLAREIREAVELSRHFPGYIWSNWFAQNLRNLGTLFAVLLGTGGVVTQRSDSALFTFSLPVSRGRALGTRAAVGLGELLLIVLVPSLLIALLAPSVGQQYGVAAALVHSACFFIVASMFFFLAVLLSTAFADPWRPILITLGAAFALSLFDAAARHWPYTVFRLMSGEAYFRSGQLPWAGLLVVAVISIALYLAAAANLARRDF